MKPIQLNHSVITGIRAKVDGSLGLTLGTPELSVEEKAEVMRLQNQPVRTVFTPIDEPEDETLEIDTDLDSKPQSKRIRACLYVLWKQMGERGSFKDFYFKHTEKIIERIKGLLE
ncbi:MAG: hypothetical protein GY861_03410 [bacterium]|nr:hypothetical protein [bacterium]